LGEVSERALQVAFCQMLVNDGHTIIHSSRHAPIEHGKDIITRNAEGIICAFQLKALKGRKLKKRELSEMLPQLTELVMAKIEHPSIRAEAWHNSYLVINAEFEEEASDLLTKINEGWIQQGMPQSQLSTIVFGELYAKAKQLADNMLPSNLLLFKSLLELYLSAGDGMPEKDKYSALLRQCLPMLNADGTGVSAVECSRAIRSAALLNAIALSPYTSKNNYYAEIEVWLLYLAHIMAVAEKYGLNDDAWIANYSIIEEHIYNLLKAIVDEVKDREFMTAGDYLSDQMFYRIRVTLLCSVVAIFHLWSIILKKDITVDDYYRVCRDYIEKYRNKMQLWGEAAVPQFMSTYWYLKHVDATRTPDAMIANVLENILKVNNPGSNAGMPNPYYDAERIHLAALGIPGYDIEDDFRQHSYTAEGLMHIFVRRNWKNHMKGLWSDYSKIMACSLRPDELWQTYLWRTEKWGENINVWPKRTKDWQELKAEAMESSGKNIPSLLKRFPHILLLFIIVCPHRCTSESVRWLDTFLLSKRK
jgi:hypothetical protein